MNGERTDESLQLPLPAELLIPHRPPMLVVEQLEVRDPNNAQGSAVLPVEGIFNHRGRVLPECFIELIAQTAGMANGYDILSAGGGEISGMIVAIDGLTVHDCGKGGATVRIETEKIFEFGTVKVIRGAVYQDTMLLASGTIKVWEEITKASNAE